MFTKQKTRKHDECVKHFSQLMQRRGLECEKFEIQVYKEGHKQPDLIIPRFNTLVEIKTLQPEKTDIDRVQDIETQLKNKNIANYKHPDYHQRFLDLLESARRQFRSHLGYSTMVVVYDLFEFWVKQDPQILMEGQQKIQVSVPKDTSLSSRVTEVFFHEKPFRESLNTEIGAVVFLKRDSEDLVVYINNFANRVQPNRKMFNEQDDVVSWPPSQKA